jgi:glutamyl/glutaminyl-tRNA synthetase
MISIGRKVYGRATKFVGYNGEMDEIVYFAPDFTQLPTVDGIRLALFSWGRAREIDGDFVICGSGKFLERWQEDLAWLNLDWDEWEDNGETTLVLPSIVAESGEPLPMHGYLLRDLQQAGYLPKAVFSYLLSLGWEIDVPLLDKWIVRKQFRLADVSAESPSFNWEKLRQVNKRAIAKLSDEALTEQVQPFLEEAYGSLPQSGKWLVKLVQAVRGELVVLEDVVEAAEFAFDNPPKIKTDNPAILTHFIAEVATVVLLDEETGQTIINGMSARGGWDHENMTQIVRSALIGKREGAPLPKILAILGKQRSMERAARALK